MDSIDICICTFRRPQVEATLRSLAALHVPTDCTIAVIIADNDDRPSAESRVTAIAGTFPFPLRYIHAPSRNISIARNACLEAATADYVAFIDDDEVAAPSWLVALVEKQRQSQADIILGPVQAIYPDDAPRWLQQGDFHSTKPVWTQGAITTGYAGNVLFRRLTPALRDRRFDLRLGQTGGEDTAFFAAAHKAGGRIAFAPEALITEPVPSHRLSFAWLLKRSFRSGQTHGGVLMENRPSPRPIMIALAAAKGLFCVTAAGGCLITGGQNRAWLLRGALHAGVVARLLGLSEVKVYGQ